MVSWMWSAEEPLAEKRAVGVGAREKISAGCAGGWELVNSSVLGTGRMVGMDGWRGRLGTFIHGVGGEVLLRLRGCQYFCGFVRDAGFGYLPLSPQLHRRNLGCCWWCLGVSSSRKMAASRVVIEVQLQLWWGNA